MPFIIFIFLVIPFSINAQSRTEQKQDVCQNLRAGILEKKPVEAFKNFLKIQWDYSMSENPEWATWIGHPGAKDRLSDLSIKNLKRRNANDLCMLEILKKIDSKSFHGEENLSYDLALRNLSIEIEGQKFHEEFLALNQLEGLQIFLPELIGIMPHQNLEDYNYILSRLERIPKYIEQTVVLLKEGVQQKIVPAKLSVKAVPEQIDILVKDKVEESPFFLPFKLIPKSIESAEHQKIQWRAKKIIQERVNPAFKSLREYLVKEYIPKCNDSIGRSAMKLGKDWYNYNIKKSTTLVKTAEELHQLGLSEVARITKAMEEVRKNFKFKGDLNSFKQYLLQNPKFYFESKEQLMTAYREIGKRIDPELVKIFAILPRLPYGIKEVPDYQAKNASMAYYESGSLEAHRAGYFVVNTFYLKNHPKWSLEVLLLHEAVPGHHLQIALAKEIENIPEFRKSTNYAAFSEGWGLYAESLGEELGLFKDPHSKFGALSFEMWRALRLVVDTGIHAKGWTRQQAINYFQENIPKTLSEIEVEVDRYITWPGQALAYKVGQLKIQELRQKAQRNLGDKFDIKKFHEQILKHGAIPLDLLEAKVNSWLTQQKKF